ncbi:MAG: hypothetical protein AB8H80_21940 [Planctomycetota bacterium]
MTISRTILSLVAISSAAVAQIDPDWLRANNAFDHRIEVGANYEHLLVRPTLLTTATPTMTWEDSAGNVLQSLALPFDRLGGCHVLSSSTGAGGTSVQIVLGGVDYVTTSPLSRQGVAVVLEATIDGSGIRQIALQETQSLGGIDPVDIYFLESEQTLWVFDYADRSVRSTSLIGRSLPDLLPPASAFTQHLSPANTPSLAGPESAHTTWLMGWSNNQIAVANTVDPFSMQVGTSAAGFQSSTPRHRIFPTVPTHPVGSTYTFQTGYADPSTLSWELQDDDGTVLTSGAVAATGATSITSSEFLRPGRRLALMLSEDGDTTSGRYIYSAARHGAPFSTDPAFSCGRTIINPVAHIGTQFGGSGVPIETSLTGAGSFHTLFAAADANGHPPTAVVSGVTLLNGQLSAATNFQFGEIRNSLGEGFSIANNPALHDVSFYLQYFFVLPNGGSAVSDIVGVRVIDPDAASSLTGGAPSGTSDVRAPLEQSILFGGKKRGASAARMNHLRARLERRDH